MTATKTQAEDPKRYARKKSSKHAFIPKGLRGRYVVEYTEEGLTVFKRVEAKQKK